MKLKAGSLRISIKLINLLPNMGIITKVHRRMKKLEPQLSGQRVKRGASEKQKVSGRSQRRRNWGEQSHKVVYELQGSPTNCIYMDMTLFTEAKTSKTKQWIYCPGSRLATYWVTHKQDRPKQDYKGSEN